MNAMTFGTETIGMLYRGCRELLTFSDRTLSKESLRNQSGPLTWRDSCCKLYDSYWPASSEYYTSTLSSSIPATVSFNGVRTVRSTSSGPVTRVQLKLY